jgi:2-polyprenyl-6-methoxyphenol hydroxylase-like FAD-dependent oxidoreductase
MAVGRHGYVGLVRVEEGRLNIAGALTLEFVKAAGSPAAALGAVVEEAGFPAIGSLSQEDWQGTIAISRRSPRTAGRRVLLLGDAAGYVEPFTGEGIAWAFAAAVAVDPFVARGLACWNETLERDWQNALRRLVRRRQYWCRLLALASRHPLAARIALGAVSLFPSIAQPVIRHVNRPPTLEFRL